MSRTTVNRVLKLQEPPQFSERRAKMTAREEEALHRFAKLLIDQAYLKLDSEKRVSVLILKHSELNRSAAHSLFSVQHYSSVTSWR